MPPKRRRTAASSQHNGDAGHDGVDAGIDLYSSSAQDALIKSRQMLSKEQDKQARCALLLFQMPVQTD